MLPSTSSKRFDNFSPLLLNTDLFELAVAAILFASEPTSTFRGRFLLLRDRDRLRFLFFFRREKRLNVPAWKAWGMRAPSSRAPTTATIMVADDGSVLCCDGMRMAAMECISGILSLVKSLISGNSSPSGQTDMKFSRNLALGIPMITTALVEFILSTDWES